MNEDFSSYVGLRFDWPKSVTDKTEFDHHGHLYWAEAYLEASERLLFNENREQASKYFAGPMMQLTGLATELTLKCLMRGAGQSEKKLRAVGHCTYNAYLSARNSFDEVKFLGAVIANSQHLTVPQEVANRLADTDDDAEVKWRVYFDHLRILDTVYDRPYRNRYMTPGSVLLPEPEIILIGTKLLLFAMKQRLTE